MVPEELPTGSDVHEVALDPALANAIGMHHRIPSALADLVDNSVDAGAAKVRIRIVLRHDTPVGLQVIDDGSGMDSETVDAAMTYAGDGGHTTDDLGHFGVGMKAASLSQADEVLVLSQAYGATPVGRVLRRTGERTAPTVGVLAAEEAEERLRAHRIGPKGNGTIVEWRSPRNFSSSADPEERARWLTTIQDEIEAELGLIFHRLLARVDIRLDTFDEVESERGVGRRLAPIDPFGYECSGDPDYPQQFWPTLPDGSSPVVVAAHVWPARSEAPEFRLKGDVADGGQGLYVYRNDRLLQAGGWCGVTTPRPELGLARVSVDLCPGSARHVTINPEKSGVAISSDLRRAIERAAGDDSGAGFDDYLLAATGELKRSRTRQRRPIEVVAPGKGLSQSVVHAYGDAVEYHQDEDPVDIRWGILPVDQIFAVERDQRELVLNTRYREVIVGRRGLDPHDAPLVKALMHLLLNSYFAGSYPGQREKRELAAWQAVLLAAVHEQERTHEQ